MKSILFGTLPLFSLLGGLAYAAPAGNVARDDGGNPPLKGSEDLLGYSASNKLTDHSTNEVKYTLLPGQKDDEDIGEYLDFENADNPQPIRGKLGATDAGPRGCPSLFHLCWSVMLIVQGTTIMTGLTATSLRLLGLTMGRRSMLSGRWVSLHLISMDLDFY